MHADLVPIDDRDRWTALQGTTPTVLQQSWAYGAALAARGSPVRRLALVENGAPVGAVQLVGRRLLGGPIVLWHGLGGPIWCPQRRPGAGIAAAYALRRRFGWRRGSLLLLTPADPDAGPLLGAGLSCAMTGYTTARLDLRQGVDGLFCGVDTNWRRLLRKGPPPDTALDWIDPRADPIALDAAIAREAAARRRRNYAGLPGALVGAIARRSGGWLGTAAVDSEVVGQVLVITHGATATYQLGWTSPLGRSRHAHHHLLWGTIERLATAGQAWLDLGGLDLPAGIVRFKCESGAAPVTFAGTFA